MGHVGKTGFSEISISATIVRADGTKEELGEIENTKHTELLHKINRKIKINRANRNTKKASKEV